MTITKTTPIHFSLLKSPRGPEAWNSLWRGDFVALPTKHAEALLRSYLEHQESPLLDGRDVLLNWQLLELGLKSQHQLNENQRRACKLFFVFDHLIGQMAERLLQQWQLPLAPLSWGQWWLLLYHRRKAKLSVLKQKLPPTPWWDWHWEINQIQQHIPHCHNGKMFVPPRELKSGLNLIEKKLGALWSDSFLEKMRLLYNKVSTGEMNSTEALSDFRVVYQKLIGEITPQLQQQKQQERKTGIQCTQCQRGEYLIKHGPMGEFLGCSQFPGCHHTEDFRRNPEDQSIVIIPKEIYFQKCPECIGPMQVRKSQGGSRYALCLNSPGCSGHLPFAIQVSCPLCEGELVERKSARARKFYGCSGFPQCHFTLWALPLKQQCPHCHFQVMVEKINPRGEKKLFCPRCRQT